MFYVDVVVKVVEAVSGQDGYDHTRHNGHRASEEDTLPLGPLDVKETLNLMTDH